MVAPYNQTSGFLDAECSVEMTGGVIVAAAVAPSTHVSGSVSDLEYLYILAFIHVFIHVYYKSYMCMSLLPALLSEKKNIR